MGIFQGNFQYFLKINFCKWLYVIYASFVEETMRLNMPHAVQELNYKDPLSYLKESHC